MSETFNLYVADPSIFPQELPGSDEQKYDWLVEKVAEESSLWETLELPTIGFMNSLEALGELAGSKKFFAVLSYNNSPNNLLGNNPEISGSFGYFTPEMVSDAAGVLESLADTIENYPAECAQAVENNAPLSRDTLEYTFFKYLSAFQEAASQDRAIVVLHE